MPLLVFNVLRLMLRTQPRSLLFPIVATVGCTLLFLTLACATLHASDWPQLLGPTRDAVYAGPALATNWPANGPRVVWKLDLGEGYSSPVVAEGRLIQCHRFSDQLHVECLDPAISTRHWTFRHAMSFRDGVFQDHGPRPTPAIRSGKVYVHNTDGYLVCLDLKDGAKIWSRHVKADFKTSATWHGCVASPLLTDKSLILNVGSTNAGGIVAFALEDGHTLWQVTDEKASASTPILKHLDDKYQVILVTREALHGLDPGTGKDFWRLPTRKQSSGNVYAASPVVFDDKIFLSGWYKLGALLLQVTNNRPQKLWHLDDALSSHYTCTLVRDGYAYGFHGHAWERGGPNLRCIELTTGKVMWEEPKLGSGTMVRAGDQLVILSDTGELQLATATPKEFKIKHRAQIVGRPTRSYPALADGFAYIKGPRQLVCVDLRAIPPPR
jgi:outer membrane protein assembly factor BamB